MTPSLRAAVIAEWRGLAERKTRQDRWQSPADLVPKLMQRLGLRERLHETEVIEAWSKNSGDSFTMPEERNSGTDAERGKIQYDHDESEKIQSHCQSDGDMHRQNANQPNEPGLFYPNEKWITKFDQAD